MAKQVGIVGLGLVGAAVGTRLRKAGFTIIGVDTDPAKAAAFKAGGGHAVSAVTDLAQRCGTVIIAVLNIDQVERVMDELASAWDGSDGAHIVLSATTSDPSRVAALAERLAPQGVTFIDAPVSGTSQQVLKGDGLGLIAGPKEAIDSVSDILDVIYPRWVHVGAAGNGSKTKLAVNLVLGLNRLALAEGLAFAESIGLNLHTHLDVLKKSAAYSQIMDVKGEKMINADYTPHGAIAVSYKDAKLMLQEAARNGQELPLGTVMAGVLEACVRNGEAERDNCAVIEEIRRRRDPAARG
jgi:3-hydroxyisobutyrate dehydrogenase-like beta-hydroxyacid dehydrogenase